MESVLMEERYPRVVKCRKEFEIEIRPLKIEDISYHMDLLHSLDDGDLAKLSCDVHDPDYPYTIRDQLKSDWAYRLAAWNEGQIVGAVVLYPGLAKWYRHTARVALVTHPAYRRYGVASVLFEETIPFAKILSITKLFTEMAKIHKEAIKLVKRIGFQKEATLRDHFLDEEGTYHNLYIYSIDLAVAEKDIAMFIDEFMGYGHRI
jgi:GNAT superfamily N-acetyltransferase